MVENRNLKRSLANLRESEIAHRLAQVDHSSPHNPYPTEFLNGKQFPAAILIPFTRINHAWHLLFIRRTKNKHDRHGGQVAFPGGRMDKSDQTIEEVALREAQEEVGLQPSDVRILGQLSDFISITNYRVTPIVGSFPWPYNLRIDAREVSRAFTIPLDWLTDPANHQTMLRHSPPHDPWPVIYFDTFDGEALWGFSARVTLTLIETLSKT
jgi:8-oxo-dGTP pyrophosphatase MutT (NUDIX family)